MTWTNFFIILLIGYIVYYSVVLGWDFIKGDKTKSTEGNSTEELIFSEEEIVTIVDSGGIQIQEETNSEIFHENFNREEEINKTPEKINIHLTPNSNDEKTENLEDPKDVSTSSFVEAKNEEVSGGISHKDLLLALANESIVKTAQIKF